MIFSYGKQYINNSDIRAITNVLKSDWITQGPYIEKFEKELSHKFGVKYVSAVCNGTAALHLAGAVLGWNENDIVITSPITFLASANCILYNNATPDFADIDEKYYTLDPNNAETKIKIHKKNNKKVKAIIGVDYAGQPCDWKALRFLADKYDLQLVNDNCHSPGAEYNNTSKYAIKYADIVCQSYHPVKHITTGEGGAVFTNDKKIDEKVKLLRSHGMVKEVIGKQKFVNGEQKLVNREQKLVISNLELEKNGDRGRDDEEMEKGQWYYEMRELGYNYRITDFQCALGISQLKKLDKFVKRRIEIAKYYDKFFGSDERFVIPEVRKNSKHSYHLYPLQINFSIIKKNRFEVFKSLKEKGINCQVHYIPVHLQPYYRNNFGFKKGDFPIAESFYEREISIPMYPSLKNKDLKYITTILNNIIR